MPSLATAKGIMVGSLIAAMLYFAALIIGGQIVTRLAREHDCKSMGLCATVDLESAPVGSHRTVQTENGTVGVLITSRNR
jgi:hypothetical protein